MSFSTRIQTTYPIVSERANANFSTIVESTNAVPISVESAIYWNVNGVVWEGGGNTVATRLQ